MIVSRNVMADAMQAVADAVHDLRADLARQRETKPYVPVGEPLRPPRWVAVVLRLCVDRDGGHSLAESLKPVPSEYVDEIGIHCPCGAVVPRLELVECLGLCGRWFLSDHSGTWAVKLPEPSDADE